MSLISPEVSSLKFSSISSWKEAGSCSRSFYIGEGVTQAEIRARFEDGILRLTVPKKDKKQVEENKYISIEG